MSLKSSNKVDTNVWELEVLSLIHISVFLRRLPFVVFLTVLVLREYSP